MINRTFEGNKYRRTYIGGSKQDELQTFLRVQGTQEDNSECDWLEYRRILTTYFDDMLHVIISWKALLQKISFIVLIFSASFLKIPMIFFGLLVVSIMFQIFHYKLKWTEKRKLRDYDACLSITLIEIQKLTGLELSK
jgi:hypothetical protein